MLAVSIVLQLFALITPLFFQVVMDKVLVHRGFSTLDVIAVAFVVVTLFEVVLGGLRSYIFAHTTSRIDVELGARLYHHLLQLPISYFEQRRVGDTVARVRELEQIRNFLTGQALTSVLDLLFSFIFIAVMWFYSGWLTLIVVVSLPVYAAWSALITPVLRARLNEKFARYADNQSFLVESVSALGTIKSMAVEPQMTRRWDKQMASYVQTGFRVTKLATIGQQGIQLIQKSVTIATRTLTPFSLPAGTVAVNLPSLPGVTGVQVVPPSVLTSIGEPVSVPRVTVLFFRVSSTGVSACGASSATS